MALSCASDTPNTAPTSSPDMILLAASVGDVSCFAILLLSFFALGFLTMMVLVNVVDCGLRGILSQADFLGYRLESRLDGAHLHLQLKRLLHLLGHLVQTAGRIEATCAGNP